MHKRLRSLFLTGIKSVQPAQLIKSAVRVESNKLFVRDRFFTLHRNCYLVGFGKAVYEMAIEIERIVGNHICEGSIISVPLGYEHVTNLSSKIFVIQAGENNLPDVHSFEAARRIKTLAESCKKDDLLLVLVSGGGSALLSYPTAPVTLAEKTTVIKLLTSAGADITEVNTVRKALSELKGGKLALLAYPATVVAFILSDIVEDPLDFIASGPTVLPYSCSSQEAVSILGKYQLAEKMPENIGRVLNAEDKYRSLDSSTTPNAHNIIIGNNLTCLTAMKEDVNRKEGLPIVLTNRIVGSVAETAEIYAKIIEQICSYAFDRDETGFLKEINKIKNQLTYAYVEDIANNLTRCTRELLSSLENNQPVFLICGGETTVQLKGNGKGGRNQELSLRLARVLQELGDCRKWKNKVNVHFLSGGTDGIDGPTDAAGAIVDLDLIERARRDGINADTFIDNNDSYSFFSTFENGRHLIKIGHTGTNVMDVHILVLSVK